MFFLNVFQDINHDFAQILQYAARVYDDVVTTISSLQLFEFETQIHPMLRRTTSSIVNTPDSFDTVSIVNSVNSVADVENQWCVLQDTDWSYDDNLRFESSVSI